MASGTIYQRPAAVRVPGAAYYDTTLGKWVDSSGVSWFDRSGVQVGNLVPLGQALALFASSSTAGNYFGTNATLARVRTPTPPGRQTTVSVVSSAAGTLTITNATLIPVNVGDTYWAVVGQVQAAALARNIQAVIVWKNDSNVTVGTTISASASSGSGIWTPTGVASNVAPAGAVAALVGFQVLAVAAAGEQFYATGFCAAATPITGYVEP